MTTTAASTERTKYLSVRGKDETMIALLDAAKLISLMPEPSRDLHVEISQMAVWVWAWSEPAIRAVEAVLANFDCYDEDDGKDSLRIITCGIVHVGFSREPRA